jgi:hypothetical protein
LPDDTHVDYKNPNPATLLFKKTLQQGKRASVAQWVVEVSASAT